MRWALICFALAALAGEAQAAGRRVQPQPAPTPPPTQRRYAVVPMAEKVPIVRHGKPATKTTYTGARDGFIPPALFYYGYPWNERTWGTGMGP